jgi:hypothetical protein
VKMARVTVTVPVDDDLTVIMLRDHLRAALEERGTETMRINKPPEGEGELVDAPAYCRIHWPAVEVKLTTSAEPAAAGKPRKAPKS